MNTLSIHVTVFAGISIVVAVADAIALAKRLDVCVQFDFNGIKIHVFPMSNADEVVAGFQKAMESQKEMFP